QQVLASTQGSLVPGHVTFQGGTVPLRREIKLVQQNAILGDKIDIISLHRWVESTLTSVRCDGPQRARALHPRVASPERAEIPRAIGQPHSWSTSCASVRR